MANTVQHMTIYKLIERLEHAVENGDPKSIERASDTLKLEDKLYKENRLEFQEARRIQCLKAIRKRSLQLLQVLFSKDHVFVQDELIFKKCKEFMCCAIQADFLEGVKFLVDKELKFESESDDEDWMAVFEAVKYGKPHIVNFLLKKQPNHVHSTLHGMTLVELACKTGNLDIVMAACLNVPDRVKYLIDNGADLTSCDSNKNTALHYLCQHQETKDSLDCIKLFVEQMKNTRRLHILDTKNVYDERPFYFAVKSGNVQIVDILVEARCDVNLKCLENNETMLSMAIKSRATGNSTSDIVAKLITAGSKVNVSDKYGTTPLMVAASLKDLNSFELLIQHGADINLKDLDGKTVIDHCFQYPNEAKSAKDVLEFFHTKCAPINMKDITEDHYLRILDNDDIDALDYLVSNGLDIHNIGKNNRNILHLLDQSTTKIVDKIKHYCDEADVNQQDSDGDTPLMVSANHSGTFVSYCLERGADCNLRNNEGRTPLMIFATDNNKALLQELIEAGADVNIRAHDGRTAIQFLEPYSDYRTSSTSYFDCLKLFLKNGGSRSLDFKDQEGLTPFYYVLDTKRVSFMWYLITQNCSYSLLPFSNDGSILQFVITNQNKLLKLSKIFYLCGVPRKRILDTFRIMNCDETSKFNSFCGKLLSLTELCRRQIRVSIGPGIEEKLQNLNIAPKLIRFICLEDLIPLKRFDINNVALNASEDTDDLYVDDADDNNDDNDGDNDDDDV